jgi:hypothetical protein
MALRMQRWLLDAAGGSLMISLAGAMILTIIFGMGMPTAAAYLVAAILVAPALQELGVPALAAHLFIFYFAILSMVTPPVALAAYAAAGLSGSNLWTDRTQGVRHRDTGFSHSICLRFRSGHTHAGYGHTHRAGGRNSGGWRARPLRCDRRLRLRPARVARTRAAILFFAAAHPPPDRHRLDRGSAE